MTEAEWLASEDPQALLRLAIGRVSQCCGCVWCNNGDGTASMAVGQRCCPKCDNATPAAGCRAVASDRKLRLWFVAMIDAYTGPNETIYDNSNWEHWRLGEASPEELHERSPEEWSDWIPQYAAMWVNPNYDNEGDPPLAVRAKLLREIVGNPFAPVRLNPAWLTPDVLHVARCAYDEDNWGALPILADALEEAGCPAEVTAETACEACGGDGWGRKEFRIERQKNPDAVLDGCTPCHGSGKRSSRAPHPLLLHLRSPTEHVRGCWALDCVLGKE
jgi:hypothetical protein